MTSEELKNLLNQKISEFLAKGGNLKEGIWRIDQDCCVLGCVHYLENDQWQPNNDTNWINWAMKRFELNFYEIRNFLDGFDGDEQPFARSGDFYLLGQELRAKYIENKKEI